jgi:hypothetical protein
MAVSHFVICFLTGFHGNIRPSQPSSALSRQQATRRRQEFWLKQHWKESLLSIVARRRRNFVKASADRSRTGLPASFVIRNSSFSVAAYPFPSFLV